MSFTFLLLQRSPCSALVRAALHTAALLSFGYSIKVQNEQFQRSKITSAAAVLVLRLYWPCKRVQMGLFKVDVLLGFLNREIGTSSVILPDKLILFNAEEQLEGGANREQSFCFFVVSFLVILYFEIV